MGPAKVRENHFQRELDMPMKKYNPELIVTLASVRLTLPAQMVDATLACSLLAGVSKPKVFLGR
jgi:hypothetical protein